MGEAAGYNPGWVYHGLLRFRQECAHHSRQNGRNRPAVVQVERANAATPRRRGTDSGSTLESTTYGLGTMCSESGMDMAWSATLVVGRAVLSPSIDG